MKKLSRVYIPKTFLRNNVNTLFDLVSQKRFDKAKERWRTLKQNTVKYYGSRGRNYNRFLTIFKKGDYILSRRPVEANVERMHSLLFDFSKAMRGVNINRDMDPKSLVKQKTREIYREMLEDYRGIFSLSTARKSSEDLIYSHIDSLGESLMQLRDLQDEIENLNDIELIVRYNRIRRQIGACDSILPRIAESFRMSSVKNSFQKEFKKLFSLIEDFMFPVKTASLYGNEDEILEMIKDGKSIQEIADEFDVTANEMSVFIEDELQKEEKK